MNSIGDHHNQWPCDRTVPLSYTPAPSAHYPRRVHTALSPAPSINTAFAPLLLASPDTQCCRAYLFPLYLTCSSGSRQTVKGQNTEAWRACKYLNNYLSQGWACVTWPAVRMLQLPACVAFFSKQLKTQFPLLLRNMHLSNWPIIKADVSEWTV